MIKHGKKTLTFFLVIILSLTANFMASAYETVPFSENGKIMSVAHLGDFSECPANSAEAVRSAFESGADGVSVEVKKTADNNFVLSTSNIISDISADSEYNQIKEMNVADVTSKHLNNPDGTVSECFISDLKTVILAAVEYDRLLIIDDGWENRNEIFALVTECDALSNVTLRTNDSPESIKNFISGTDGKLAVTGKYHGNILFNARAYINKLSKYGSPVIELGTKNSFGVIFQNSVMSAFGKNGFQSRAMIQMTDSEECGKRTDTETCWSDVIDRGYSVIETNRISALNEYLLRIEDSRVNLMKLIEKAENTDFSAVSSDSTEEVKSAINQASNVLTTLSSLEKISVAENNLITALNNISKNNSDSVEKGKLNITPIKIFAIIIATTAFVLVQFFFYYRRADKYIEPKSKTLRKKR